MTDRELLELAAKAAGLELDKFSYTDRADLAQNSFTAKNYIGRWNPLTDDGDALRLAVKLEVDIFFATRHVRAANRRMDGVATCNKEIGHPLMVDKDPYAATRRAIVRAAAEIGRNMRCRGNL